MADAGEYLLPSHSETTRLQGGEAENQDANDFNQKANPPWRKSQVVVGIIESFDSARALFQPTNLDSSPAQVWGMDERSFRRGRGAVSAAGKARERGAIEREKGEPSPGACWWRCEEGARPQRTKSLRRGPELETATAERALLPQLQQQQQQQSEVSS